MQYTAAPALWRTFVPVPEMKDPKGRKSYVPPDQFPVEWPKLEPRNGGTPATTS